jgi:hypothetical protein
MLHKARRLPWDEGPAIPRIISAGNSSNPRARCSAYKTDSTNRMLECKGGILGSSQLPLALPPLWLFEPSATSASWPCHATRATCRTRTTAAGRAASRLGRCPLSCCWFPYSRCLAPVDELRPWVAVVPVCCRCPIAAGWATPKS